jgi:Domain of unknown function (DUF4333)
MAALLACGCGGSSAMLDTAHVERAIAATILAQHHIHATVACPEKVPRKQGTGFTCLAHLSVGTYPVRVNETNSSGHVRYGSAAPLAILGIDRVQRAIERSILQQRHVRATVACPPAVLQRAGITFTCEAAVGGRRYPFSVTELDNAGHVHYVGER